MITTEKFNDFVNLYNEFTNNCLRICKELTALDDSYEWCDSFVYVEDILDGDTVECFGFGGSEDTYIYRESFPASYLTMNDEEFSRLVKLKIEEKNKKEQEEEQEELKRIEEMERKEYERLKKKFEK